MAPHRPYACLKFYFLWAIELFGPSIANSFSWAPLRQIVLTRFWIRRQNKHNPSNVFLSQRLIRQRIGNKVHPLDLFGVLVNRDVSLSQNSGLEEISIEALSPVDLSTGTAIVVEGRQEARIVCGLFSSGLVQSVEQSTCPSLLSRLARPWLSTRENLRLVFRLVCHSNGCREPFDNILNQTLQLTGYEESIIDLPQAQIDADNYRSLVIGLVVLVARSSIVIDIDSLDKQRNWDSYLKALKDRKTRVFIVGRRGQVFDQWRSGLDLNISELRIKGIIPEFDDSVGDSQDLDEVPEESEIGFPITPEAPFSIDAETPSLNLVGLRVDGKTWPLWPKKNAGDLIEKHLTPGQVVEIVATMEVLHNAPNHLLWISISDGGREYLSHHLETSKITSNRSELKVRIVLKVSEHYVGVFGLSAKSQLRDSTISRPKISKILQLRVSPNSESQNTGVTILKVEQN